MPIDIEDKIISLNKVQNAYNFGKFDPCNYHYLEILRDLKVRFKERLQLNNK